MLELIESENNTGDISLQNTLITGSGRNTHLLLMDLRSKCKPDLAQFGFLLGFY